MNTSKALNYVACHQEGILTHLGDAKVKAAKVEGIFAESRFEYQVKEFVAISLFPSPAPPDPGLAIRISNLGLLSALGPRISSKAKGRSADKATHAPACCKTL